MCKGTHQPAATANLNQTDKKICTECPLLGKRVVITGTSREDLNGRAGVATSFDHDHDRYLVELDGDAGEKEAQEKLKLKPGGRGPGLGGEEAEQNGAGELITGGDYMTSGTRGQAD